MSYRLARLAVKAVKERYEHRCLHGYKRADRERMHKDIGALIEAFEAAQTTVEGLEKTGNQKRDKQVVTATRLQLKEVVEDWRESGTSVEQLLFRLQTRHITLPDQTASPKGCCDE